MYACGIELINWGLHFFSIAHHGGIAELISGTGWIQADEGADSVTVCFRASKNLCVHEDGDQRCKFGSIFFETALL